MMKTRLAIIALLLTSGVAEACNVPVFRYALERWRPDAYQIVLFKRGPLTPEHQEAMTPLYKAEEQERIALQIVDLDKPLEPELEQLWNEQKTEQLPWLVVHYPLKLRIARPVWAGALDATIARLIDSPIRQELAKRLTSGQTAVWLMLDSGDPQQDDAAVATLESQLKKLPEILELPELTATPEDEVRSSLPLTMTFSLLRVSRKDDKERMLIESLLGTESDLRELSGPMVFPVFGRGRALFPSVGAGITADNITTDASFLVGPCSCQLKEFNPGFDLLTMADWDSIFADNPAALAIVQAEEAALEKPGESVPIPQGEPTLRTQYTIVEHHSSPLFVGKRLLLIGGIGIAAVLAIVALVAAQRTNSRVRPDNE